MDTNQFLDKLFGTYASMKAERFHNRYIQMGKNPTAVHDFYKQKGCIKTSLAGNGVHYHFINYLKK